MASTPQQQLRKPLSEVEKSAKKATVCVTGAAGYLASSIVGRLLASPAGHSVRGTVRDPSIASKNAHLWALPGAKERLKLFKADLTDPSSFDEALKGCTVLIHTASPVIMKPEKGRERELLIDPAVQGAENVLRAATRAKTVTRVVMTSSFAAVCSDISEHGENHAFTEADWNETASETYLPYHCSKVRAERRAYEIEREAKGAWTLATICPPIVQGPPAGNIKTETIGLPRRLLHGFNYPWVPRIGMAFVDVDDVAFAHCSAAFSANAKGRYLIASPESMFMLDYANLLRPEYGDRKLPFLTCPLWLVWFGVKILGNTAVDWDLVSASAGRLPRFDTSKAARDLGLTEYFSVKRTAIDMADELCRLGIVKGGRAPGSGAGGGRKQD